MKGSSGNGDKKNDGMSRPIIFQESVSRGSDDLTVSADIDDMQQKSKRMSIEHARSK